MRVGVVNRFPETPYLLGDRMVARGLSVVHLEPTKTVVAGGELFHDGSPVTVDVVLWRLSEGAWSTYGSLGWACAEVAPIVNPPAVISLCADKIATAERLTAAGIPAVPGYIVAPGDPIPNLGPMTVVKPVMGAGGRGVHLATPGECIPIDVAEEWMAQPWAGESEAHLRVLVINGVVVCAYRRVGCKGAFVNNIEAGGTRQFTNPPTEVVRLALAVTDVCGAYFAGVDLVPDPWRVLEVNSCPGVPASRIDVVAGAFAGLLKTNAVPR